ncbi:peptidylprolyl isomerase [Anaplasma phagocytophilum]|uniref:peptidylprolyl isomerase n=1 Tax=Anaplasma phagocytophilum TaxID=948 RepID=UPI000533BAA9|nr:peptidylprolyl isomerase [Anaplasma phagocytophilum]KDB57048.1 peptidylprolyl isomerase [Anaplasma phagocytophilum str. CRT35]
MRSRKIYVWVVMATVLGAVAFVTFGSMIPMGKLSNSGNGQCVAMLGNKCLPLRDYRIMYRNELAELEKMLQHKLSDAQINQFGIKEVVLKNMIADMVVEKFAHDLGIRVGSNSLRSLIKNIRIFQDANGVFDQERYEAVLADSGMTESSYVNKIRNALPSTILMECLFPNRAELHIPYYDALAKDVVLGLLQHRVADIVEISSDAVDISGSDISDDELQKLFEGQYKNSINFPEYRSADYIIMAEDDLLADVIVSDQEVDVEIKNSELHDQRDVLNLVFTDKNEAELAYKAYQEGKSFEELVSDAGYTIEDIALNNISKDVLPVGVRNVVFALNEGEVSEMFRSVVGWHIMKVISKHEITKEDLEKLKEKISSNIKRQKASELLVSNVKKANDMISRGASLNELKDMFGARVSGVLTNFDMHGLDQSGNLVKDFPLQLGIDAFTTLAFSSAVGKPSHLVSNGDAYFGVLVTEVVPPRPRTLEESRSILTEEWKSALRMKKIREFAVELRSKLQNGTELSVVNGVSFKKNVTVKKSDGSTDNDSKYPERLVDEIFAINIGGVTKEVIDSESETVYIALLKEIKDAEISEDDLESYKSHFVSSGILSIREQLLGYLMKKYGVTIENSLLEKV